MQSFRTELENPIVGVGESLSNLAKNGIGSLGEAINDVVNQISKTTGKTYQTLSTEGFDADFNYAAAMEKVKGTWQWHKLNKQRNAKIEALGLNYDKWVTGTPNAKNGWALTAEEGYETMMTKYGQLIKLGGGESIFSKLQTDNLWALSKMDVPDLTKNLIPKINPIKSGDTTNYQLYGDIHLDNVVNADGLLKDIARKINTKS